MVTSNSLPTCPCADGGGLGGPHGPEEASVPQEVVLTGQRGQQQGGEATNMSESHQFHLYVAASWII